MAAEPSVSKLIVLGDLTLPEINEGVRVVQVEDVEALLREVEGATWPLVVLGADDMKSLPPLEQALVSVACNTPEQALELAAYTALPLWDVDAARVALGSAWVVRDRLEELDRYVRSTEADHEAFVHAVSHDLKGPLQGIIGLSGLLMEQSGVRVFPEVGAYATRIESEADRLAKMISALTAFTRLGNPKPKLERVDLASLIDQLSASAIRTYTQRFPRFHIAGDIPDVQADEELLTLALNALLDNAVRFTESGPVNLTLTLQSADNERCVLRVQDAGMGIPEHALEVVFDLFTRLDRRRSEGIGVGLTMARKAIELCDGRLWLTSTLGEGTCAHIELVTAS